VFLDSNVIFSGLYSAEGAPATVVKYLIEGRMTVVISQQVLDEVVRTIKAKLPEALPFLRKLLVNSPLEIRKNPTPEEVARWAEVINPDAGILAAATDAEPDYLITGDSHFFKSPVIGRKSGLQIVTPGQFLERLE
jgi:putative PIN family toxin of toxin-antitoxin system